MARSRAGAAGGVSVVIPTKDRAGLLWQTLRSLAEQTAPVAEVIVVDDGSTDDTASVVAAFGGTYVRHAAGGLGPGRARNAGLDRVSTDLVAFVDSDDLLLPGAIGHLRRALGERPEAPFAYGQALVAFRGEGGWQPTGLIATGRSERSDLRCALFARNSVPSSGAVVRTAAARAVGAYDPSIPLGQDHHLWLRLMREAEPVPLPEVVCVYRRHSANLRRDALAASPHSGPTAALAEVDRRLAPCLPDRIAVELCQQSVAALKGGRPDRLVGVAWRLLSGRPAKLTILWRAAAHHTRVRRASRRSGLALWQARADIREWLDTYPTVGRH